jgi:hypothetical protein
LGRNTHQPFERQQGKKHKQVSRGHHWSIIHTKFKTENGLPRCSPSKRLRYEKQIKALHLFRLLSLEMSHRRVELEKKDFRKYSCMGILVELGEMLWLETSRTNDQVQRQRCYR